MTEPRDPIKSETNVADKYQLILDMLDVYDADGDLKLSITNELDITDEGMLNALNCIKKDNFITVEEMKLTFQDPSMVWLLLQNANKIGKHWLSYESLTVEGTKENILYKANRGSYRSDCGGFNIIKDFASLINSDDSNISTEFVQKIFALGIEYRKICVRTKSIDQTNNYEWLLDIFRGKEAFKPENLEKTFKVLDAITCFVRDADDLNSLKRNIDIMLKHNGFDTIISQYNINQKLTELRDLKPDPKFNYVVVYDKSTLEARIVKLNRGVIYYTTENEAVVGSRIWDKGNPSVSRFKTPHDEKAMETVPWLIDIGRAYLDDTIAKVKNYIQENEIYSQTHKGKLISEIDPNLIRKLTFVEIMGDDFMNAGENEDWNTVDRLVESIYFRLGAYGKKAFHETVSKDNAKGMCQLTKDTYLGLRTRFGHLMEDFDEGSIDHFNSILTQFMLIDEIMRAFNRRITTPSNEYFKFGDLVSEKIKDPEIFAQFMAISYNRGEKGFRWLAGLETLEKGSEPDNHRRKYLVIRMYFIIKPHLPLLNLMNIFEKSFMDAIEPYHANVEYLLSNAPQIIRMFESATKYLEKQPLSFKNMP